MKRKLLILMVFVLALLTVFSGCKNGKNPLQPVSNPQADVNIEGGETVSAYTLDSYPEYAGSAYVEINNNTPYFTEGDLKTKAFEYYGKLDRLGRCTECTACLGKELMPTEKRGDISAIKPSGWQSIRYDFVDGGSLYNRCHLIAYMLTGENANPKNLITGTRYMNTEGMLPFEELVSEYIKRTENHVLYRVSPIFEGDELVARGVLMEAYSVEDGGKGVCFNVYCYNVQPGVTIDYATGKANADKQEQTTESKEEYTYYLNTSSKKFHKSSCKNVSSISEKNRKGSNKTRDELIAEGYSPCGECKP